MMNSVNFNSEDSAVNTILKELSPCFESTFAELFSNLKHQEEYELLRRCGEQQFYNPESAHTMEQTKEDLCAIDYWAKTVDNTIDTLVTRKFQGDFRTIFKEDVLKAVLKLYSDQDGSAQEKSISTQSLQATGNPEVKEKENGKIVLGKSTDVKYLPPNLKDISKKVIEENTAGVSKNAKTVISNITEENIMKLNNDSIDLGNFYFDKVSSVHTSDLSSFDDEISISSDEEYGQKRKKLSLKLAEAEVNQIRATKKTGAKNQKRQAKHNTARNLESEVLANDTSSVQQKSLPSRARKPNSKYNEFDVDVVSPLKKKIIEKSIQNKISTPVQESETVNSLPRKRGRPRKITQ